MSFPKYKFSNPTILRFYFLIILVGFFMAQFNFLQNFSAYFLLGFCLFLGLAIFLKNWKIGLLSIFFLSLFYGNFRSFLTTKNYQLQNFANEIVEIEGVIDSFPDIREDNKRVFLNVSKLKKETESLKIREKVLLIVPSDQKLEYGDFLQIRGKISLPKSFSGFDYQKYLHRFGAKTIVKNPESIQTIKTEQGNWWLQKAKISRNWLAKNLQNSLPEVHSVIAMGVLLGVKTELPNFVFENFQKSGLMHLLVVSGTNVAIVILVIAFLLKPFGRRIILLGSILSLLFFVGMTGADPPVLRASLMGGMTALALAMGKMSDIKNLVLLSAIIIGIFNPMVIQSDIGFFLSFSATLGIVLLYPIIDKFLTRINFPNFLKIRDIFGIALSAQIAVLPILGFAFAEFSWAGIFANLLSEPLMPLIMFFSFFSSVIGFLPTFLAEILAIPAFLLIEGLLRIANLFGSFPLIPLTIFINWILAVLIFGFFGWKLLKD